ncbi:hypothetical protein [Tsukamurella soli]|uniref:Secreted protein n=1 Tax=Tsukamurella soli TaxID=644556 RepID=A0ABP8KB01_9ACTN
MNALNRIRTAARRCTRPPVPLAAAAAGAGAVLTCTVWAFVPAYAAGTPTPVSSFTALDGCHRFVIVQGHTFWVRDARQVPTASSWDVAVRGWPRAGCDPVHPGWPAAEPCDPHGSLPCGTGGSFLPGITDGDWINPLAPRSAHA